jgi:protocatechuate 3,4-dioxygenase alpha subunit
MVAAYLKETSSQTAGPYLHIGLLPLHVGLQPGGQLIGNILTSGAPLGERIRIEGEIRDGAGAPVCDGVIEIWQADSAGHNWRRAAGEDNGDAAFRGFGRAGTDFASGLYWFETIKPGAVQDPNGRLWAPHVNVWIAARGINIGLHTRLYFSDEEDANALDPLLRSIEPAHRRKTLIAPRRSQAGGIIYRFDIVLQGDGETVFLDL